MEKSVKFKQFQFLKGQAIERLQAIEVEAASAGLYPAGVSVCVEEALTWDALTLAYIGDAVYSLYVRERMMGMKINRVQVLHTIATECINAKAQSKALEAMEKSLTDDEAYVARRARNSNVHVPKSASVKEYRNATAFEAILGFLHITGQEERKQECMHDAYALTIARL